MNCFMCKGEMTDRLASFIVDLDSCIVIVKNVPTRVCDQCGEKSYIDEVGKQLMKIVNSIKSNLNTEIAVINYSNKVA